MNFTILCHFWLQDLNSRSGIQNKNLFWYHLFCPLLTTFLERWRDGRHLLRIYHLYKIFRLHSAAWSLIVICAHTCDFCSSSVVVEKVLRSLWDWNTFQSFLRLYVFKKVTCTIYVSRDHCFGMETKQLQLLFWA